MTGTGPRPAAGQDGPQGALSGIRVLEMASLAPAPLATLILEDFGADVVVVERPPGQEAATWAGAEPLFAGGKQRIRLDLKDAGDQAALRDLAGDADVFVEAFRPGVAERLGIGPDALMADNPRLIYARVTGWGQDGAYARRAGHDINYIAVAGALSQIGLGQPAAPPGLLGDHAGGSFLAVIGILLALHARERTGRGQVVDVAMVDGIALLLSGILELDGRGLLGPPHANPMRGAAPFYRSYECADGRWFSVGAVEPKFYQSMLACLGLADVDAARQLERADWPTLAARIEALFRTRTRDEWAGVFADAEGCGTPVLELGELAAHPHLAGRGTYLGQDGGTVPAPAPRLSATPGRRRGAPGGGKP
jgi:alpha-methylacyl-CoA racemase